MTIALYMDEHVRRAITNSLRLRGIKEGINFSGVIYAHQQYVIVGDCVRDLEIIAKVGETEDLANQVQYLPL